MLQSVMQFLCNTATLVLLVFYKLNNHQMKFNKNNIDAVFSVILGHAFDVTVIPRLIVHMKTGETTSFYRLNFLHCRPSLKRTGAV